MSRIARQSYHLDVGSESLPGSVEGRYAFYDRIASGGMATIHLGRMLSQVGFAKVVAIKRLHPHLASDPDFLAMFLDEARMAARINHPNVVSTLDIVSDESPPFLVMDYVDGDSLSHLIKATRKQAGLVEPAIASAILSGALYGLHAAHNATDERGELLEIVHRDVSPQNILVGRDGIPRVLDFGVAKAARRIASTEAGRTKGKFSYMAPEQVRNETVDARADVFAAGVCLWETLTGRLLFAADDPARTITRLLELQVPPPSSLAPDVSPALDAVALKALERDPARRYGSAREMAMALEDAEPPAIPRKVGAWVQHHSGGMLDNRTARLAQLGSGVSDVNVKVLRSQLVDPTPAGSARSAPQTDPEPVAEADEPPTQVSEPSEISVHPDLAVAHSALESSASAQTSNVSQVLAVSHTDPPRTPSPERRVPLGALAAVVAMLALASIALLVLTLRGRGSDTASSAAASAVSAVSVGPSATPAVDEPAQSEDDAVAPALAQSGLKAPLVPSAAPAPAPAPAPTTTTTTKTPAPQPPPNSWSPPKDCNPPYVIDEQGIKRFKRHCL